MSAPHTRPDSDDGAFLRIAGSTSVAVADALDLIADLPSTPDPVAREAQATAGELSESIAAAGRHPAEVEVSASCVVSAAGILALVGAMPSTPPAVASDAASWSQELWERLDEAPHGPGAGFSTAG